MAEPRRLMRSESNRMLAGVAGGLGEYLKADPTLVRIGFVLLAIFGGSGLLLYLLFWAIIPTESRLHLSPTETAEDAVREAREAVEKGVESVKRAVSRPGDG